MPLGRECGFVKTSDKSVGKYKSRSTPCPQTSGSRQSYQPQSTISPEGSFSTQLPVPTPLGANIGSSMVVVVTTVVVVVCSSWSRLLCFRPRNKAWVKASTMTTTKIARAILRNTDMITPFFVVGYGLDRTNIYGLHKISKLQKAIKI